MFSARMNLLLDRKFDIKRRKRKHTPEEGNLSMNFNIFRLENLIS